MQETIYELKAQRSKFKILFIILLIMCCCLTLSFGYYILTNTVFEELGLLDLLKAFTPLILFGISISIFYLAGFYTEKINGVQLYVYRCNQVLKYFNMYFDLKIERIVYTKKNDKTLNSNHHHNSNVNSPSSSSTQLRPHINNNGITTQTIQQNYE